LGMTGQTLTISRKPAPHTGKFMMRSVLSIVAVLLASGGDVGAAASLHDKAPVPVALSKTLIKNTPGRKESALLNALSDKMTELEIRPADVTRPIGKPADSSNAPDTAVYLSARVPKGRPLEWIAWKLAQASSGTSYSISDCVFEEKKQVCVFVFSSSEKKTPRVQLSVSRGDRYMSGAAEIAIVGEIAEDTAYQTIVGFLSLPEPMAVSIIPGKKQSALIAQLADRYHKEVILRLPLEPASKIPSDFCCPIVMVHYSKDAIRSFLSQAIKTIPTYAGFNNFWGSRALEDSRIMGILFTEIKKNHGYFLETKTARNSVARPLAETIGVPFGEMIGPSSGSVRQADVEKHLRGNAATAQNSGAEFACVVINAQTVAAVKALLPWYKQNGIALVFPSKIVQ